MTTMTPHKPLPAAVPLGVQMVKPAPGSAAPTSAAPPAGKAKPIKLPAPIAELAGDGGKPKDLGPPPRPTPLGLPLPPPIPQTPATNPPQMPQTAASAPPTGSRPRVPKVPPAPGLTRGELPKAAANRGGSRNKSKERLLAEAISDPLDHFVWNIEPKRAMRIVADWRRRGKLKVKVYRAADGGVVVCHADAKVPT